MEDFEAAVRAQVRAMVSAGEAMTITRMQSLKTGVVEAFFGLCR